MLKVLCHEYEIITSLISNRTKVTSILTNVINKYQYKDILKRMSVQKFSLLIDKSADKGSKFSYRRAYDK